MFLIFLAAWDPTSSSSSPEGALLARGPSGSHCSELFMVSTGAKSRLSPETFSYTVFLDAFLFPPPSSSSLPPSSSPPYTYGGCFPPPGASSSCAPIGPRRRLCRADVRPRRPSAALNGPSSLSDPLQKQLGTARHGHQHRPGE